MIWFSADFHFGHANIIKYCNRPFKNVEEMDETIIKNWNSIVSKNDTSYFLGDFSFAPAIKYLARLNGTIICVRGNHEKPLLNCIHHSNVPYMRIINIPNYPDITLSHFALRVWNKSHFNSWHLFGHSHGKLPSIGKSIDVGVDTNNFYPYSLNEISKIMETKPDNFNLIKNK